MVAAARSWIVGQLLLGEFKSRGHVVRRSIWMALKMAALAYALNLAAHFALYAADLLPYDLFPALVLATVLTPPVSFIVAVFAYAVVGFAVYDLGVSRAELERLSRCDSLTGLLNRHSFQDAFDRCEVPVTMALFDIDRFKMVNDLHGHKVGDEVIVAVSDLLRGVYGDAHVLGRLGGDEFGVLSTAMDPAEARVLAEAFCRAVAAAEIPVGGDHVKVTISGGLATSRTGQDFSDVFGSVDSAVYFAKAGGRNQITSTEEIESLPLTQRFRSGLDVEPPFLRRAS